MLILKIIGPIHPLVDRHLGRYVQSWSPHCRAGELILKTTADPDEAKVFRDLGAAFAEWAEVSNVQAKRPWDGKPNKPLTSLSFTTEDAPAPVVGLS